MKHFNTLKKSSSEFILVIAQGFERSFKPNSFTKNIHGLILIFFLIFFGSSITAQTPNNSGGGGTFVVKQTGNVPMIIAGGGGGASGQCCGTGDSDGGPGVISNSGSISGGNTPGYYGIGGTGGNGGGGGGTLGAGAGGGFTTNGGNGLNPSTAQEQTYGGASFLNGGTGGIGVIYCGALQQVYGGFGGGGGASHCCTSSYINGAGGGGGGYSGGGGAAGSSNWGSGGGGGSYNIGTSQVNYDGSNITYGNSSDGTVMITWGGGSQTFNKIHNTLQYFTVPAGVISINIVAKGAKGGDAAVNGGYSHVGGKGAYMSGVFSVSPGDVLKIIVGEIPESYSGTCGTPLCTTPTAFSVTGGGTYCSGGAGLAVGLNGSETGINYQLLLNGSNTGSPVAGTGSAISFGNQTSGGTYTVLATNTVGSCTNTMTGSGTITVTPVNTITLTSGAGTNIKGVCYNTAITNITYSTTGATGAGFSGLPAGIIGNWAGNVVTISGSSTVTGTANYTVTLTGGCGTVTATGSITVNPVATINAISNQVVCNNVATSAINFSSPTTGGTIVYNWTNNTTSIGLAASGSGNISSFTATNVTGAPVTATITVTPAFTNGGVTCNGTPVTFTITVNPAATVNTIADQLLCNNSSTTAVTFSSPTTGGTIIYNWTNNTPSIGLAASGTGNITSFTATNATTAPVMATITVTPAYTNGGATCNGTPKTFSITVNPTPTVDQPSSQVVCNNAATSQVSFTGPVAGTIYSWTNDATSIGLAASGTGNIASFTATNTSSAPVVATVTVTPTTGTSTAYYIRPSSGNPWSVNDNNNAMDAVFGAGNWTLNNFLTANPATVFVAGTRFVFLEGSDFGATELNNFLTTNLTLIQNWVSAGGGLYLKAAPNVGGNINFGFGGVTCIYPNSSSSATAVVPGHLIFSGPFTPITTSYTGGSFSHSTISGGGFTNLMTGTGGSILGSLNWGAGLVMFGTSTGPFAQSPNPQAQNLLQNIISFVANTVVAPATCTGPSITFTITVNPTATVNAVSNQTVCNNGSTSAVNFGSPTTGGTIVYNWTNNTPSIGLAASGAGNIAGFTATNATTAPVTATITVTPAYTNGGVTCNGTPITFTITVNPTATVNAVSNQTVCNNGSTSAVNFGSLTTGGTIVYNWINNTPSIGLASSGAGNISSFTATNATTAPVTATITVTPAYTNGGVTCNGTPITFTYTVNPTATVNAVTSQTVCDNEPTSSINFISPATGGTIVYNWTNSLPSIGLAASGTGDIASFTAINSTNAPVTATIIVTPVFTNGGSSCNGTSLTVTISVNPTTTINSISDQTICNNGSASAVNFSSPTTGGTIVYNWINNTPSIGLAASGAGNIAGFTATNVTAAPVTATITATPSYTNVVAATFIECNTYTGDDRGGIVATLNNIYLTGDGSSARFNHDLTGAVWLGVIRDALFSDLSGNGTVYSFANAGTAISIYSGGTINQIWQLDANLATVGFPINLSSSVTLNSGSTIFSGSGYVLVHNAGNDHFYRITLPGGVVTDMGASILPGFQSYPFWTESWAKWGFSEYSGGNYYAIFRRSSNQNIESYNVNTGAITVLNSYTNLSDMASIVYSPWDNRIYVHWEGGTQWGGYDESVGYLPYSSNSIGVTCTGTPITFTYTVNPTATVNAVSNQTICNNGSTSAVNFGSPTTGGTIVYNWINNTPSIGLASSGAGNISSFTATNATTAPVTATITVTPAYTNGGITCTGTPITFTITVNPTATVNAVSNQTVCNNESTSAVNFGSPTTGGTIVYNWINNTPSIGLASSGAGNIAGFTATNATTAPVTATITVTPAYTNGGVTCTGTPITFTITVNPTATVNAVSNQTVCNNGSTSAVNFGSPTTGGTIVYNWTSNTPSIGLASSGAGNIAGFTATNAGTAPVTATITVTPAYTNDGVTCNGTPITFTYTVNPTATVNAVSNQTVCDNGSTSAVNFGSPTTGGTIVYNWINNTPSIGLASSGAGNIAGFTATNATTAPVTATITVTPGYTNGGVTCTGTPITFTYTVNPTAIINAVTDQALCNGATSAAVNFNSLTTGGTIVYNWTNNTTSIGLAASGIGNIPSFIASNTTNAPVIATITVTPTYSNGGVSCIGTPITFMITVNPPPLIDPIPSQVICNYGSTGAINFTTPTTGGTAVYSWTNNNTRIGLAANGTGDIPSFIGYNDLNVPNEAIISVVMTYTSGGISCVSMPEYFTITVNPEPSVDPNTIVDQRVCPGTLTSVNFGGPVDGTEYTWVNNNTATGLSASGTGNISFIATNTTVGPIASVITVTPNYTNGGITCVGAPVSFVITVNPTPTMHPVLNQVLCNGSTTNEVVFTGTTPGSGSGTVFYWTNDNTSIGLAAYGSGSIAGFIATNSTNVPVTALITVTPIFTEGGVSCTGNSTSFTITVNPTPVVNVISNQILCAGSTTLPVTITGPVTGTLYSWTNNNPAIGLEATGTSMIPAFTAINNSAIPITGTITIIPFFTNGGITCSGAPVSFTITVNPRATVNLPADQVVCNGLPTSTIILTGAVSGTTYSWTNNNTSIGLASSGTGNIGSFIATNTTIVPVTASITVTPSLTTGCAGSPESFTITVNPIPAMSQPLDQTVCAGVSTTGVVFTGTVPGTIYNWTNSNTSIGLSAGGTGDIPAFKTLNSTAEVITATIVVTPLYINGTASCPGVSKTFTITVNPTPKIVFTNVPSNVCLTDTLISLQAIPSGGTWTGNGVHSNTFSAMEAGIGSHTLSYTYTNVNGCVATETVNILVYDCKERHNVFPTAINIYPNPSSGQFNIRFQSDIYTEFNVRITTLTGQELKNYHFAGLHYGSVIPMDLRSLPGGTYFIEVYNKQEKAVFNFVLQH